jgi:hypothetical protein
MSPERVEQQGEALAQLGEDSGGTQVPLPLFWSNHLQLLLTLETTAASFNNHLHPHTHLHPPCSC